MISSSLPDSSSTLIRALVLGCALVSGVSAMDVPYDYVVPCTPENAIFGHFSATKKPVLTVKSGSIVRIEGGGGGTGGGARPAAGAPVPTTEEETVAKNKFYLDNH